MKDSALRLQDKTILLVGPFNGTTQAILRTMTEFGADIAYVNDSTPNASRFVDGINEAGEVHPHYGRAAFLPLPAENEAQIKEALGRMAETFGRMDVLIDASPLAWTPETDTELAVKTCKQLAQAVLPFLKAKQKGRIVYVIEDSCLEDLNLPALPDSARDALNAYMQDMAIECLGQNVTVNGLALGVTEDYILRQFPKSGSIRKSLDELQKSNPTLKLVESTDVALGAAYFASALCGSVTGQILRLTHGFHLSTHAGDFSHM